MPKTMAATTGQYEQSDGQPVGRFERIFPHPVSAVWGRRPAEPVAENPRWAVYYDEYKRLGVPVSASLAE